MKDIPKVWPVFDQIMVFPLVNFVHQTHSLFNTWLMNCASRAHDGSGRQNLHVGGNFSVPCSSPIQKRRGRCWLAPWESWLVRFGFFDGIWMIRLSFVSRLLLYFFGNLATSFSVDLVLS